MSQRVERVSGGSRGEVEERTFRPSGVGRAREFRGYFIICKKFPHPRGTPRTGLQGLKGRIGSRDKWSCLGTGRDCPVKERFSRRVGFSFGCLGLTRSTGSSCKRNKKKQLLLFKCLGYFK